MSPWPRSATRLDVDAARAAARHVVTTHQRLAKFLRHGQTLAEIDRFVAATLADLSCKSCFLDYTTSPRIPRFPSHACLSVGECVVHGTAGYLTRPLREGDLLKIDIGVRHRGWIGDAAWTYHFGTPAPLIRRLMDTGKESLRRGVLTLEPGEHYIRWARAVQGYVEGEQGFHLIRGLGGHGLIDSRGRPTLHAPPFVSNVVPATPGEWPDAVKPIRPGTLIAVEPMIAVGTGETKQAPGQWPVFTADASPSVHYEHDVLITENGPEVLTEGLEDLDDEVRE